jgi:hypothetical protein
VAKCGKEKIGVLGGCEVTKQKNPENTQIFPKNTQKHP